MTAAEPILIPERFPGLERRGTANTRCVLADAPGGTQAPESVIEAVAGCLRWSNANPNRPYPASVEALEAVQRARAAFAGFADGDADGIVFGPNMTSLTWHFARAFESELEPDDVIVCTQLDHDANVAPWLSIAKRRGAEVRFVKLDPETFLPAAGALESVVDGRTRLIAFTRASNLLGSVVDPRPFVDAARAVGAVTYADAVHSAAHLPLAQREHGIDAQVCSAYKIFGPHLGVLSVRPELLQRLDPDRVRPAPSLPPARRWETGMPSFEAIAGLEAAVRYVEAVGYSAVQRHERGLTSRALEGIAELAHVRLHGRRTGEHRSPTFAVTVDGFAPRDASARMAEKDVFVSAGTNYAIEPLRALGLDDEQGVVRLGFVHYHSLEDVDRALAALADLELGERRG